MRSAIRARDGGARAGLTLRARLTLVYTAVFAAGGAVLLGANYAMVSASLETRGVDLAATIVASGDGGEPSIAVGPAAPAESAGPFEEVEGASGPTSPLGDYQDGVLSDLLTTSVAVLVAVAALAALAGWLIAGRPMRRLHAVTETARHISERDLHSRLALTGPDDEFRELGDTFDGMLSRLERAFEAQRRFVANASHELRTPLAVQKAAVEVPLSQGRVPEDLKPAFTRVLDSVDRSERLLAGLLLLARSDRGLARTEPVDLAGAAENASALLARDAREAGVDLRTDLATAEVEGDPVLLEHLVRNLLDNAVHYNVPGGWVEARVRTAAGRTVLRVANTGGNVTDPESLFEPFHRGDAARVRTGRPGSGLGLAIVRSIASAHGARAEARARPGGGLVVTVGFPAAGG
ncbi:HAMP domain-containing protein [Nocardiopsis akebiae]|uniref:histidine kinase n=1 Tax=Nocardiopsis akebiae TaxID=2831968 RepID=A0ABX8C4E9_9ACTN|nr:ATP-binding protein [Nocardiopsis akebiae]QUX29252.1 HAMP domain-containing protein [Nocardiopsis akebiae]